MNKLLKDPWGDPISMRKAYGEALIEIGKTHPEVVVLSADVSNSDHSFMFEAIFPERFYNVGIAEPALVDIAVGLANAGKIPIANTFAFLFATRALEQVRTHLCYGQANVKLAGAYGGLSDSFDGPTHHSITDLAIMRSLPHMTVVVPSDTTAVKKLLPQVVEWDGPVFIRLCRNEVPTIFEDDYFPQIGKGVLLNPGNDVTIICNGVLLPRCIRAVEQLALEGISAGLIEIHTLKPIDSDLIEQAARQTGAIVTVEEHSIIGGLGSAVAEVVVASFPTPVENIGLKDTFAETGPYDLLLDKYCMAIEDIIAAAKRAIWRKSLYKD
jgi:transketolase